MAKCEHGRGIEINCPVCSNKKFRTTLRLLLDTGNWKIRDQGKTTEELIHKDGWIYYSDCHCITLRNDNSTFEQVTGIFAYIIIAPVAWINTLRVKRKLKGENHG